jgi:hypothetical protein
MRGCSVLGPAHGHFSRVGIDAQRGQRVACGLAVVVERVGGVGWVVVVYGWVLVGCVVVWDCVVCAYGGGLLDSWGRCALASR